MQERFSALDIVLTVPEEVLRYLSEKGSRDNYGARHLRRQVQEELVDRAACMLLEGSLQAGDSISAMLSENGLKLHKT